MTEGVTYGTLIRELPSEERPRERLRSRGAAALSNAELIAILLRTGCNGTSAVHLAENLLARLKGLPGLRRASFGELKSEKAIGEAKAAQILAALELGKRIMAADGAERRIISGPADVFSLLFGEMALLEQEEVRVVLLNARNELIATKLVYQGNVNSVVVRTGDIFREAIREAAPTVVVVHNHPSGDPSPSAEDTKLTRDVVQAGKMLGIEVLDHVVLGRHVPHYVSMKDRHLGFD